MNSIYENWTKEEFSVYLMFYAANADKQITAKEQKMLLTKAGHDVYEKISEQFAVGLQTANYIFD